MVICLERVADLHTAQLMPLPLSVSCFSKIQIGLAFWYRPTRVVPEKGPLNVCVCVCVCVHVGGRRADGGRCWRPRWRRCGRRPTAAVAERPGRRATAREAGSCSTTAERTAAAGWTARLTATASARARAAAASTPDDGRTDTRRPAPTRGPTVRRVGGVVGGVALRPVRCCGGLMSNCCDTRVGWLGSRVVSVLDSGAKWPGFKSQPRRYRVTVLGKLFTPIVPLFTKQQNW